MSFIRDASLSVKLIASFTLCALITLSVGLLGSDGIAGLSSSLKLVFSNNLLSVSKTAEAKNKAVEQNRDLYRLLSAVMGNAPPRVRDEILASAKANRAASEKAFAIYRATSLEDDERAAGNKMEKDWPAYQALVDRMLAALTAGDVATTRTLLDGEVQAAYTTVMDELTLMVESNNRQIGEGAENADRQESSAKTYLYVGVLLAFMAAIVLGLIISRGISRPIALAVESAKRVAAGDLTQTIISTSRDETGQLLTALADMQTGLKITIQQIASAADQLASAAEELNAVTEESGRGLARQNAEIQQAATAVTEMTTAAEAVARNAASTSEASNLASAEAQRGRDQTRDAATAINDVSNGISSSTAQVEELASRVRDIEKVLDVIRGIADQTNLLALNAAIEAARAGEQGRGFAVVADEVRALAARTQASTGEIEGMIGTVQRSADKAVLAMGASRELAASTQSLSHAAGEALERIAEGIAQINDRNLVVATAAEQQANVAREVDRNLSNIHELSTQTAAGFSQTSASSHELSLLAISFSDLVGKFKL